MTGGEEGREDGEGEGGRGNGQGEVHARKQVVEEMKGRRGRREEEKVGERVGGKEEGSPLSMCTATTLSSPRLC